MVDPFFNNFFKKLRYCEEKEIILIKKKKKKQYMGKECGFRKRAAFEDRLIFLLQE